MKYYRTVTFLAPSVALTNFPVLVRIQNDTAMARRIASASGYDVAFTTLDGTALNFELDYYDSTTGSGAWWVRIPSLASGSTTTIKMVYGDSTVTTDQSSTATWDTSTYHEVLHYRTASPKCVLGNMTVTSVSGAAVTNTSAIGKEVCYTSSGAHMGVQGKFTCNPAYPSCTYNGYSWAMGMMSLCKVSQFSTTSYFVGGIMGAKVTNSNVNYGSFASSSLNATTYHTRPRTADWTVFSGVQYYLGTGSSMVNLVVDGTQAFNGTDGSNMPNGAGYSQYLPAVFSGTSISVAETRFYKAYVPTAWMQYEQLQILNHDSYTTYGDEYNADGTQIPLFVFRPWLYTQVAL